MRLTTGSDVSPTVLARAVRHPSGGVSPDDLAPRYGGRCSAAQTRPRRRALRTRSGLLERDHDMVVARVGTCQALLLHLIPFDGLAKRSVCLVERGIPVAPVPLAYVAAP